jgi:Fur family transcriptional regulator, ferric uptake regulator
VVAASRQLRACGLRATPARIAVLEVLAASTHALSQADLLEHLPARHDRTTIFRVLTTLVRVRILRRVDAGDRVWRYQFLATADSRGLTASFVCTECDRVTELVGLELRATGANAPRAISRRTVEVLVRGVCDACT